MTPVAAQETRFVLGDEQVRSLAAQFGTPLYVIDEKHLRDRARRFVRAWDGDVSFASKANCTLAVLKTVYAEGCSVDAASEGELRFALKAGVPAAACRLHGSNKSQAELDFGIEVGVGKIVVDCFEEIERLVGRNRVPDLLLRLAPGVDPKTHSKISTGQADTKFGFSMADAPRAVARCLELGLPLIGYHCHVGSQLLDPEAQITGAETLAKFAVAMKREQGFEAKFINVGGGLGVRYTSDDRPMEIEDYCRAVRAALDEALNGELSPAFGMEPGRSIVAESGVTVYTVGVVKTAGTGRVYVGVDGGLSDNPRPVMYSAKYDLVWHSGSSSGTKTVTVSGKHCETDALFADVQAPTGVAAGDLVQVLCTGAYNSSMASNYNCYPRPATVFLRESGEAVVVQKRESWEQLLQRDVLPEGL